MSTKKKLYIVVLIWAAVALQIFITKRIDRESQMVTQVMSDGVENVTAAEVKLYAHYGDETMTEAAREKILQRVGEKLGIISGYDIITSTEGENTSTTFVKKWGEKLGDTTIRLISMGTDKRRWFDHTGELSDDRDCIEKSVDRKYLPV